MAERERPHGIGNRGWGNTLTAPTAEELRAVNEQLLIAGLREHELVLELEDERDQLAVILAGIGDAVLVVDEAGALVRTNAAYTRLVGTADAPLIPQDAQGRPLPINETPQVRAGRGETFSVEFTLPTADGSRCWFEAKGQPLRDHAVIHAVVVIRDITVSSQQRHLQDEFLSLASHELRTPITSVQGYLDLLLRACTSGTADERILRYATQARRQMHRLTTLVGDLTDVARLQSGKLTLARVPVELEALTTHVVEIARDLPPGHTIHLDTGAGPIAVQGDAGRLEQVLLNLLTNAFAYAPSAAAVEVRLWRQGDEVALEVRDHGHGIAADQVPHLFTRFYQVVRADRSAQGGLGLGLFIVREIVAAHGGHIEVASIEGVGTTFTIWLPILEPDVDGPGDPGPTPAV